MASATVAAVGENVRVSNPYAPPEDGRRPDADRPGAHGRPAPTGPHGPPTSAPAGDDLPAPAQQPQGQGQGPQGQGPQGQGTQGQGPHGVQVPPHPHHHPAHQGFRQQHPGQQPVPPPIPTDPEGAAQARGHARTFGLLLLASAILGTLHIPWQALALPFIVAAVVYGIRAALTASRAHVRGALVPMLIVGIAISAVWAMVAGGMLLLWPLQAERQACLADALTHTARAQCEQDFRQGLENWQDKLRSRSTS